MVFIGIDASLSPLQWKGMNYIVLGVGVIGLIALEFLNQKNSSDGSLVSRNVNKYPDDLPDDLFRTSRTRD